MSAATRPDWATIPNLVTLLRFVLLAPVCVLLLDGPDTLAVVLLLVWASTDWVDGLLARLLDQTSRTGAIIDPIADRVGLAGIVLSLAIADLLSWAALAIIVLVDLAMAVLATGAALGGRISVSWLGKVRTFVLMGSVFVLVAMAAWMPSLVPLAQVLFWIGVAMHTASGIDYILRARRAPAHAPVAAEPPSPR
ncbi:CDP-alcohol phosphatidyltransferase family protein [Brachybacterium massiliense]|uniref:CDP-alcohol phosphatidyltransferase family protein n=1 Tax=Brachybacterium massiliense TaxID=1755098 RepID=UPI000B3BC1B4|nr:CDP-alcohol phosphatidyltransferase family protein [Brachybacterium massiliense]